MTPARPNRPDNGENGRRSIATAVADFLEETELTKKPKTLGKLADKKSIDTKKKRAAPKRRKRNVQRAKKPSAPQPPASGDKLSFNHAMCTSKMCNAH